MAQYHLTIGTQGYLVDLASYKKTAGDQFAGKQAVSTRLYADLRDVEVWAQQDWVGGRGAKRWTAENSRRFIAGSGLNTASRDKFPKSVLPRTFDFGFATGLMVKDVRLCLEEAKSLGLSLEVAEAVGKLWETVIREMGADSDFTAAIKPIEQRAGVVVGKERG